MTTAICKSDFPMCPPILFVEPLGPRLIVVMPGSLLLTVAEGKVLFLIHLLVARLVLEQITDAAQEPVLSVLAP